MKLKSFFIWASLSFMTFTQASSNLDEGMWLLDDINRLPLTEMRKNGWELTADQIYNSDKASIKDAIVLLGGGTASFVSNKGLILTNHHVAYGAIVSVSSVMEDRLKDGFSAQNYDEELPIENMTAQVLISMREITNEVLETVSGITSADDRQKAITAKLREIEKTEKGITEYECRATDLYNGVKYYVYTFQVMKDVRLVYAPPNSIGNYGGEVDNWMWPRHTGDFSFMRAYVSPEGKSAKYSKDNVPFQPKHFLPFSIGGFDEGTFMMIIGFPGRTFRYRTAADIELAQDETLPLTVDVFKTRIDIINKWSAKDRADELKYANRVRGLENTYKNFIGTLEGMKRINLVKKKQTDENEFINFISRDTQLMQKYGNVLAEMKEAIIELKTYNKKRLLMTNIQASSDLLRIANRFLQFVNNPPKDSSGKVIARTDADYAPVKTFIESAYKNFVLQIEKEQLFAMLLKAADLPAAQQLNAVKNIVKSKTGDKRNKAIQSFVDEIYTDTDLLNKESAQKLLMKKDSKILDDDFVEFASMLDKDDREIKDKYARYESRINNLRALLMEGYIAWKGGAAYPDANRTIRFTYGTVKTLAPRDATVYNYITTLTGVMEKESDKEPFDVAPKLRTLWTEKDFGPYIDKRMNDVPVAFLADLDITGGNSGSPIINGKGELTGCAFDGNWESIVGDYYFEDRLNRVISVDSRYILFILDKFSNAKNILNELVIK